MQFSFKSTCLVLAMLAAGSPAPAQSPAQSPAALGDVTGQVVLVDFWASWCAPCRHSFPWLNDMQAKYGPRGLVVIGVNVDRERGEAERFLRETPAGFQILYDPDGSLAARYDVPGMPSSYVFSPDGELVGRHIGFRKATQAEREAELVRLLAASAGAASAR
jgi:thiol-disulfide isomerase/thioredoxin